MKKALYLMAFLAVPVLVNAQDAKKQADKEKMSAKCMEDAKAQIGANATEEQLSAVKSFCDCQSENILKEMTYEEYETMEKDMEDPAKQQALAEKLMPLMMPCLEQLQKAMGQ